MFWNKWCGKGTQENYLQLINHVCNWPTRRTISQAEDHFSFVKPAKDRQISTFSIFFWIQWVLTWNIEASMKSLSWQSFLLFAMDSLAKIMGNFPAPIFLQIYSIVQNEIYEKMESSRWLNSRKFSSEYFGWTNLYIPKNLIWRFKRKCI